MLLTGHYCCCLKIWTLGHKGNINTDITCILCEFMRFYHNDLNYRLDVISPTLFLYYITFYQVSSLRFFHLKNTDFSAVCRIVLDISRSLRWYEQELIIEMLQPEAHQGVRDLLPVDGVQVDVPLVLAWRKVWEMASTEIWTTYQSSERRVHILPQSCYQAHLENNNFNFE